MNFGAKDLQTSMLGLSHWLHRHGLNPDGVTVVLRFDNYRESATAKAALRNDFDKELAALIKSDEDKIHGLKIEITDR